MGLRQLYFGVLGPMIQQSNDHLYHLSGVNLCSLKGVLILGEVHEGLTPFKGGWGGKSIKAPFVVKSL